ncbi:MBL fold metallo-hydrolase RNA specificity domain-containing protein [Terrabacter sp. MAHUQ-38]|uniref:MBL fold metallo-hydrolase RNA specificity domain-containing protein n=1 Tax=unclassified Terrabacter TaxID=2630222 RepID=UPI00165E3197|nr:MBL fold metallo-hydrolase [Terrabacter sp. MAHUQ-38]MBC9821175.1 MBL fold metallo-hydrolase [Terrabacter sp. MAHUQ-38]
MTTLTFLGAAGTVTGSKFLLEDEDRRVLVDCGLYQGERQWRRLNWEDPGVEAGALTDVVLTHTHLDHCGYLPALVHHGYTGPVWATAGTAALADIVLHDAAKLQEEDAANAQAWGYSKHHPPLPLYTWTDADRAIELMRICEFGKPTTLESEAVLTFVRAGHVLGSASAHVALGAASVLFSGDLGRPSHPLLLPRDRPPAARTVVVESTYGDRVHPDEHEGHQVLGDAVRRTIGRGGSVLIPAFAVDRTELVLLALAHLRKQHAIPDVPIYVDSPMALAALDVYQRPEHQAELRSDSLTALSALSRLRTARTSEESKRLNTPGTPCIIVSASGMATGGRVVHHLRSLLPNPRNTVVLTGYQAAGTRGRLLQEGARELKMMGQYVRARAEIVTDEGFSVHADSAELLQWLGQLPEPPKAVYVVHGEPRASSALADAIGDVLDCPVVVPRRGERVLVD